MDLVITRGEGGGVKNPKILTGHLLKVPNSHVRVSRHFEYFLMAKTIFDSGHSTLYNNNT